MEEKKTGEEEDHDKTNVYIEEEQEEQYSDEIFAKSYCPYCVKAKDLFKSLKVPFNFVDLDAIENGAAIQSDLAELTGQKTVPNIFIKGEHVGGCDKVHQLNSEGKLLEMI